MKMEFSNYTLSTYKLYNQIFYKRLLDLRDGNGESRGLLWTNNKKHLAKSNFFGTKSYFWIIFHGETLMEKRFEILFSQQEIPSKKPIKLFGSKVILWVKCNYEYFEGILQDAYEKRFSFKISYPILLPRS